METEKDMTGAASVARLTLHEQTRHVKKCLRGMMNGTASASMREKGLAYKVNFGVELPRLQALADELPHTHALAEALWMEDIRECRLLAGMLMPDDMTADEAQLWADALRYREEADCTVMHLFCRLACASECAFRWVADERPLIRHTGYQLFARLFMRGLRPTVRDAEELLDHIASDLAGADRLLARTAYNTLLRFADLGPEEERLAAPLLG